MKSMNNFTENINHGWIGFNLHSSDRSSETRLKSLKNIIKLLTKFHSDAALAWIYSYNGIIIGKHSWKPEHVTITSHILAIENKSCKIKAVNLATTMYIVRWN